MAGLGTASSDTDIPATHAKAGKDLFCFATRGLVELHAAPKVVDQHYATLH